MKRIFPLVAAIGALLAFGSISAQAVTPVASTGPATNIAQTSATLNGYLDPSTISAYYFVYGTSTGYGQQTAPQPAPAGSGVTLVQANVSGLSAGTNYHFQLIVIVGVPPYSQSLGGGDQTFKTASNNGGGGGGGGPGSSNGSLRLVGRTLSVKKGKVSVSLWCLSSQACRGSFAITASGQRCVGGKSVSLAAGAAKTIKAKVSGACRTLLANASKHRVAGRLTGTVSTGQHAPSSKVTLVRRT